MDTTVYTTNRINIKPTMKKEVSIKLEVEGRLIEERWFRTMSEKDYERIIVFIYKYFTKSMD